MYLHCSSPGLWFLELDGQGHDDHYDPDSGDIKVLKFGRILKIGWNSAIWSKVWAYEFSFMSKIWLNFRKLVEILELGQNSEMGLKFCILIKSLKFVEDDEQDLQLLHDHIEVVSQHMYKSCKLTYKVSGHLQLLNHPYNFSINPYNFYFWDLQVV